MLLTPHVFAGMLAGSFTSDYVLSPFFGLASYFILEIIPHWDPENHNRTDVRFIRILDIVVATISFFVVILMKQLDPRYVLGGIFAAIPYLFFYFSDLMKINSRILTWKKKFQYTDRSAWGILIQGAICIIAITIIFNLIDFPSKDRFLRQLIAVESVNGLKS